MTKTVEPTPIQRKQKTIPLSSAVRLEAGKAMSLYAVWCYAGDKQIAVDGVGKWDALEAEGWRQVTLPDKKTVWLCAEHARHVEDAAHFAEVPDA